MIEIATTKIYKNKQTAVPSEIRKRFNLKPDSIVKWNINKDGNAELIFDDKKPSWDDLAGIGHSKERTNAVELKKELYK